MSSDDKSHSVSYPSGVLSSDRSLYQGNESSKDPSEDVSLAEECSGGEGVFVKRGSLEEDRGDSIGKEPQAKEVRPSEERSGRNFLKLNHTFCGIDV